MPASSIPASDRIVVALWRAGQPRAARQYAGHALARNDPARAVLIQLVEALEAGQGAPGGETPALDFALVASLVDRYRFHEADTVLRAAGLTKGDDRRARRLASALDAALAPFPADADPSYSAALQLVRAGQAASALRAIEEVLRQTIRPPDWLVGRQRSLGALVRGTWWEGPEPIEQMTRDTVLARVRARDLPGALEAAERAKAAELAGALRRLVEGTERLFTEPSVGTMDEPETVPMEGHGLAELHIRMGMLAEADVVYRKLLENEPGDERARAMLADVVALRRALGQEAAPVPPREVSSVHWLSKKGPKRSAEWGAGPDTARGRFARFGDDDSEDSTDVLAAADEAELLIKLGKADQALAMYRILAVRHPNRAAYRRRIEEIEALVRERAGPMAEAVTARHDLSALMAQAVRTDPKIVIKDLAARFPQLSEIPEDDDATATLVDARRDRRDDE